MDEVFLEALVVELRSRLCGAAVNKIFQCGSNDLVFRVWTGRDNLRLLLSADPGAPRLYLTTTALPNPAAPPRFCQLLRSRLRRLLTIERVPGERIVLLRFAGAGGEQWEVVAEFFGNRPNLILIDGDGRIVDALQRITGGERPCIPGQVYPLPPPRARFLLATGLPAIPPGVDLRSWLLHQVTPMSPLVASDLAAATATGVDPVVALEHFRQRWVAADFAPGIAVINDRPVLFAFPPDYLEMDGPQLFDSSSAAAEAFYASRAGGDLFGGGRRELESLVAKAVARLEKRLAHIAAEEERAAGAKRQREFGDLLLANLHLLRRGLTEIVLTDWYTDPPQPVCIPLDPALSPQENAAACFRRHRKGKRALKHIERRRAETRAELEWLGGVALALDELESPEELGALRAELAAAGLLKLRPEPGRARQATPGTLLRSTRTPGGFLLYWGRNNRSNDRVSRELTAGDDLWFHAHNIPGCHLVLKRDSKGVEVPEEDIEFAAALAAGYSRGRDAARVDVIVAAGREVRKPKGVRPGLVSVGHFRTVRVIPRRLPPAGDPGEN
ncbi:hypothetical protein DBW_1660 [Desulfuromonas sp. DDH964]|uniref:Rqc2 family fibronectin-binding protein n=1 Tax=Desulfuromonas sp. DDH964 TaxID=1823759 RepID=UPI00078E0584|nr:NFACT RNA binding domain-containing protein [Desulfuromonas sp. DDH964]AMV72022.1 hypothetical protein DBW_1660 [Desulfuromonas sp. DDH964]